MRGRGRSHGGREPWGDERSPLPLTWTQAIDRLEELRGEGMAVSQATIVLRLYHGWRYTEGGWRYQLRKRHEARAA